MRRTAQLWYRNVYFHELLLEVCSLAAFLCVLRWKEECNCELVTFLSLYSCQSYCRALLTLLSRLTFCHPLKELWRLIDGGGSKALVVFQLTCSYRLYFHPLSLHLTPPIIEFSGLIPQLRAPPPSTWSTRHTESRMLMLWWFSLKNRWFNSRELGHHRNTS